MEENNKHKDFANNIAMIVGEIEKQTGKSIDLITLTPSACNRPGTGRKEDVYGSVKFYPEIKESGRKKGDDKGKDDKDKTAENAGINK